MDRSRILSLNEAAIQAELERILSSSVCRGSERRARLLKYLVSQAIAGQTVKEYAIGVDVFEKPADYDPRTDPAVRVEMGRLRARLAAYYGSEGLGNPFRLELPVRSYIPVFRPVEPGKPPARSKRRLIITGLIAAVVLVTAAVAIWRSTAASARKAVGNSPARELCARARFFWNRRTPEALRTSVALYQEAIRVAPRYAPAYAGEALAYAVMATNSSLPADQTSRLATETAREAIALNDNVADAHAALALLACEVDFDRKRSEVEFARALALDPNFATTHHWRAMCLLYAGRTAEATAEIRRAVELDPVSMPILGAEAMVSYQSRHYDETIRLARRLLEMDPTYRNAHLLLGQALEAKHEWAAAEGEFRTVALISGGDSEARSRLAHLYAETGRTEEAEDIVRMLTNPPPNLYVDPYQLAFIYTALNQKSLAFDWLGKAIRQRTAVIVKVDPYLDPLRGDPQFQRLLAEAHLN